MIIHKHGRKREDIVYDYHFTCPDCETIYQLERGDKYKIEYDQRDGDAMLTWCPVCGKNVWTDTRKVLS